jgi:hypothetical protein
MQYKNVDEPINRHIYLRVVQGNNKTPFCRLLSELFSLITVSAKLVYKTRVSGGHGHVERYEGGELRHNGL